MGGEKEVRMVMWERREREGEREEEEEEEEEGRKEEREKGEERKLLCWEEEHPAVMVASCIKIVDESVSLYTICTAIKP